MKNLSRLTALLLAVLLLFQTAALANTGVSRSDLDRDTWDAWVQEATEAAEEQSNTNVTITEGGEVYDLPTTAPVDTPIYESTETAALNLNAAGAESEVSVVLPQYGKVQLTVGESGGQWQVQVGEQWINVAGENGSVFDVTFAKVQSLFQLNGYAKVRYVAADGAFVSDIAVIGLSYGSATLEEEEELESVTDEPVMATFARRSANDGIALAAEDGTDEQSETESEFTEYSVVIKYVRNSISVATEHSAKLSKGATYSATVQNPSIVGYAVDVDNITVSGNGAANTEISKNLDNVYYKVTNLQGDVTITVPYTPIEVEYKVRHFKQNLNDDGYTEVVDDAEIRDGLTESLVPAFEDTSANKLVNEYAGFTALWYEQIPIAGDGSTVINIYYDRNYYLMSFELDGGWGVEPIYARYGADIPYYEDDDFKAEDVLEKPGYTFVTWYLNGNEAEIPKTMPAGNRTYVAQWKPREEAKVTVVFWGQNANDNGYSYYGSGILNKTVGDEFTYNGETLTSYNCGQIEHTHTEACNAQLTCTLEVHAHSSECCSLSTSHTHTTSCYNYVGSAANPSGAPSNPKDGQLYVTGNFMNRSRYIYISGRWYEYTAWSGDNGSIIQPNSSCSGAHTHGDGNCTCSKTQHTHSDACYSNYTCGLTAHTHTSACEESLANMAGSLWTLKESDTATVAPDGSTIINVYYDRTEFTLTFKYGNQQLGTIKKRWGANIVTEFTAMCDTAREKASGYSGWEDSTTGNYVDYIGIMPKMNKTLTVNTTSSSSTSTMTYYIEDLDGNDKELFKIQFKGSYKVTTDEYYELEGFTIDRSRSTSTGSSCNGAKFYYTRNSYNLDFNDGYSVVKSESVKYEAPLSTYKDYKPAVPSAYEPGSVTFGGWYLNPECTGAEYKLEEHTMPANDVLLYAKWVPVNRHVNFYLDKDAMTAGMKLVDTVTVPHGSFIPEDKVPTYPDDFKHPKFTYFIGWFYTETVTNSDGTTSVVEKAYDFENMPIRKDLNVYGKWSSTEPVEYTVRYVWKYTDENGEEQTVEIAAATTGKALPGNSKTFEAKVETELDKEYQTGYFPVTASHTMELKPDAAQNVYDFVYVEAAKVPYQVRYLIKNADGTTKPAFTNDDGTEYIKKVDENKSVVVTEPFKPLNGYLPDAAEKRLVLSVKEDGTPDTEKNVIIFYYEKNETQAYYTMSHYYQNLDGTYTEVQRVASLGDIGTTYNAAPLEKPADGFEYVASKTEIVVNGTTTLCTSHVLDANGLEIKHYYDRFKYDYIVRYLEYDTNRVLATEKTVEDKMFGETVSESAIEIPGYTPTATTANLTISTATDANVITFYYTQKEITINYVAVGPAGATDFGSVDPETETVKAKEDVAADKTATPSQAKGSTATPGEAFKFVGWYVDAECTTPVGMTDGTVYGTKFTPAKNEQGVYEYPNNMVTYYAKFEYNLTDLTITKEGANETLDPNACFIFTVTGEDINGSLQVVIKGNGSATITGLTVGKTYTVTEAGAWSWRYTAECTHSNGQITLVAAKADNEITFTNTRTEDQWIDSDCYAKNNFGPASN